MRPVLFRRDPIARSVGDTDALGFHTIGCQSKVCLSVPPIDLVRVKSVKMKTLLIPIAVIRVILLWFVCRFCVRLFQENGHWASTGERRRTLCTWCGSHTHTHTHTRTHTHTHTHTRVRVQICTLSKDCLPSPSCARFRQTFSAIRQ